MNEVWISTSRGRLFARVWDGRQAGSALAPVVLLHDSLGCVDLWRNFPLALSEATGRLVVAYDRLGFGRSDAYSGEWAVDFLHQEAEEFFPQVCRQLGIGNFVVMGHSVGGGMAALCAAREPDRCQGLIMESAQEFVEDRTLAGIRAAREQFAQPEQLTRLSRYHADKARWVLQAWTESWLSPQFQSWNLDADLPRVRCPTLVIHGMNDEFGSRAHPERIGQLVTGPCQVELLPDCGHVPHREEEAVVLALVRRFLGGTLPGLELDQQPHAAR